MKSSQSKPAPTATARPRAIVAELRDVIVTFDSFLTRALDDVTFEIHRGEIFGLAGPTGSGKSTALRLLAGDLSPTQGKVKVLGRAPRWSGVKSRIGYLPQLAGANEVHRKTGLHDTVNRWLSSLGKRSRSQSIPTATAAQRRTQIAQAVLGSRELVLLDEPFAGLDPAGCGEMRELIRSLAARGQTVVLSGDSLAELKEVCHRLAFFWGGKIQAVGALAELLATTDAIRFAGPVLPPATAERVLTLLRDELRISAAAAEPSAPPPADVSIHPAPADEKLRKLLGNPN